MESSVEEKQSYLSRKLFLLLKYYQACIEFSMFMVGRALTACVRVDGAEHHRCLFTFSCKTQLILCGCAFMALPSCERAWDVLVEFVSFAHTKAFSREAFLLLVGILEVASANPFFGTPLNSHSVSNNLVIFHHISSAKLSISDAILSRLQYPLKIVLKRLI